MSALRDVVADSDLYLRAKEEDVMGRSLMRFVNERTLVGQFRRILDGGARLTEYVFRYFGPRQVDPASDPIELSFRVEPLAKPPTNIHVLIGRNGVGKAYLLNAMSRALVYPEDVYPEESDEQNGRFADEPDPFFFQHDADEFSNPFANIVSVTFSAFDDFPVMRKPRPVRPACPTRVRGFDVAPPTAARAVASITWPRSRAARRSPERPSGSSGAGWPRRRSPRAGRGRGRC